MLWHRIAALLLTALCVLARRRRQPEHFAPDKYATEPPFLSDRWPIH